MTDPEKTNALLQEACSAFEKQFDRKPVACGIAPGRVEILGNHTDYNGGRVLSAAIDRFMLVAGSPATGKCCRIYSIDLDQSDVFDFSADISGELEGYSRYPHGVLRVLAEAGLEIGPMDMVVAGNVPIGSGLSSSAAFEAATAMLVKALFPYELDSMNLALLLQRAENVYAGMPCGLLDQFSSIHGIENGLLFLNCMNNTYSTDTFPVPAPALVVCDSRAPHELTVSPYPIRREECERVAQYLCERMGKPDTPLCGFTVQEYLSCKDELNDPYTRRADHVLGEHVRVTKAEEALRLRQIDVIGDLMKQSHISSMKNFENSTPEIDELWELASRQPGWLGGRITGGGWGGCTVNLVEHAQVDEFVNGMKQATSSIRDVSEHIYVCHASAGARSILL